MLVIKKSGLFAFQPTSLHLQAPASINPFRFHHQVRKWLFFNIDHVNVKACDACLLSYISESEPLFFVLFRDRERHAYVKAGIRNPSNMSTFLSPNGNKIPNSNKFFCLLFLMVTKNLKLSVRNFWLDIFLIFPGGAFVPLNIAPGNNRFLRLRLKDFLY